MNDLPVTLVPKSILKRKAQKVTNFGPDLHTLAQQMVATMRANNGMGLAAPQVGVSQRIITLEYEPSERGEQRIPLTVLINPTITDSSRSTDWLDEGCLSIPNVEVPVERPDQVNVLAEDLDGNRVKIRAKGLHARILQHEIDHLNGVLMTERAFPKTKDLAGLRVLFFGTPVHAIPYLSALASTDAEIVGVVTETDKPVGRKQILTAPPVKQAAQALELPVFQFESLRSPEAYQAIADLKPDIAVVVAYGQIIPTKILSLARFGFFNVHYSLLPALRGPSPHQTAVLTGLKETGFTIFQLDKGVDTGPILVQKKIAIEPHDTSQTLIEKMITPSVSALLETLPEYIKGNRQPKPQDDSKSSHTRLFTKEDGRIDWTQPAEAIERQIRAMQPWPVAFTQLGDERLLIHAAHLERGKLTLNIVQPAGGQPMKFSEWRRGNRENWLTFLRETDRINHS